MTNNTCRQNGNQYDGSTRSVIHQPSDKAELPFHAITPHPPWTFGPGPHRGNRIFPSPHKFPAQSNKRNHLLGRYGLLFVLSLLAYLMGASRALAVETDMERLLERIGKQVEHFDELFSTVTCSERVFQQRLNATGKLVQQKKAIYDSLIFLQGNDQHLTIDESRLPQDKAPKEKTGEKAYLVTNGFSVLLLIFHPHYQPCFKFTFLEEETQGGKILHCVRFRHVPGTHSPSVLQLHGHEYPLEWEGTAWIDFATGSIIKIKAGLMNPMEDLGLKKLDSEVHYAPVKFNDIPEPQLLPLMATVEAETAHQHWKNIHQFSGYRLFSVETESRIADVPTN
jgi:hypothetical protein